MNRRHAKWIEFSKMFPYVIKYKKKNVNIVVDALLRRYALIPMLNTRLIGFNFIIKLYKEDSYFKKLNEECMKGLKRVIFSTKDFSSSLANYAFLFV